MKRLLVAVAAALAALAVAAPASAHNVFVNITCEGVTFTYTSFPSGQPSSSDQTVTVNDGTPVTKHFGFTGPGGTDFMPLTIVGDATVVATFAWDSPSDDEQGSGGDSEDVSCGGETTGGTTGETTGQTTGETTGQTTGATTGETTGETTGATTGETTGGGTTGGGTTGSGGVIGATTGGTTGGSPGAETGGELPFTGLPVWIPVLLAFALLVSGGFLLRRKRDDVS